METSSGSTTWATPNRVLNPARRASAIARGVRYTPPRNALFTTLALVPFVRPPAPGRKIVLSSRRRRLMPVIVVAAAVLLLIAGMAVSASLQHLGGYG